MAERGQRPAPKASRAARTALEGVRARVGTVECVVANLSSTGAGLRSRLQIPVGREVPLVLDLKPTAVNGIVRVMRCEPLDVALPGAVWRRPEYALGVAFIHPTGELLKAVRRLTKAGIEESSPRVLVLGAEDDVSRLIDSALSESGYLPRVLTDPRYAIRTAKQIGAKAVIVNLRIDPEFSARSILDALRTDPATNQLPVLVCARQAWLQPSHVSYITDKRLRLLLVPFTPEELVLTLDRAIEAGS